MIRKTDNELVRFIKQTKLIDERKRYEELMNKEKERREKGLNDAEKRMLYFRSIEALDDRVYNKPKINDEQLQFSFLHDRKNYLLRGERWRPFFIQPPYAKHTDFSSQVPLKTYVIRVLGSLILMKLGYEFGIWDGLESNQKLANSCVVDMETEEQIYDYLYNKDKTAVFLFLYTPGHYLIENFHRDFITESAKYKDEIVFMRVPCRNHLTFCINKQWTGRVIPPAEAYFINEKDVIEIADMDTKFRSKQGIEAFFEEHGIIEARLEPERILNRIGEKFLQIV
ncbi:UNKNOWN [Stylonychia lemnae]|uniref:Uncharacterized protein n=1 Tax=Stylonychia lemnae TaxID=5949 RepID=A0A078B2Z8_STYLE|nr:UNKNOWN [Stylonychia lemnae]|eukprot:CDW87617.1 UNKNOWN [Stylonychia lemnae]